MNGKFIASADVERDELDWGTIGWLSRPESTGAQDIVAMEVSLSPGYGHDFHKHPDQEEVIYVIEGSVCLLYTSPSPRDRTRSRMPSSA